MRDKKRQTSLNDRQAGSASLSRVFVPHFLPMGTINVLGYQFDLQRCSSSVSL